MRVRRTFCNISQIPTRCIRRDLNSANFTATFIVLLHVVRFDVACKQVQRCIYEFFKVISGQARRQKSHKTPQRRRLAFVMDIGSFHLLDQSFAETKETETKRLNFGLSPESSLTNHRSSSSLTSSAAHR